MLQPWRTVAPDVVKRVNSRGSKGDFLASIIRNDPKDRRLAATYKRNYERITGKVDTHNKNVFKSKHLVTSSPSPDKFYIENVEISTINGEQFHGVPKMAELSQLWMSDHAHFWYFLETDEVRTSITASNALFFHSLLL